MMKSGGQGTGRRVRLRGGTGFPQITALKKSPETNTGTMGDLANALTRKAEQTVEVLP